jgi:hypothetical protein
VCDQHQKHSPADGSLGRSDLVQILADDVDKNLQEVIEHVLVNPEE